MLTHLLAAAIAALAPSDDALAVIAVAAPPGPTPELVEMTLQLRAACRERDAAVQDVRELRARLGGERATSTLAELERAYAGALLTSAHGDPAAAARTLRGVLEELERGPESPERFEQWTRAQLRLALVESAAGHAREYADALDRLADVHPQLRPDPDQYSPTLRRDLDAARARVALRPHHALRIGASGSAARAEVFVDGRPVGGAPVTLQVSEGRHRVAAVAGGLRVPGAGVEVGAGGADAVVDVELAAAVRLDSGPALAIAAGSRDAALLKAGAWLEASRIVAASIAREAGGTFLVGALLDVRRGSLLREGRVRTAGGVAAPEHVAALSTFLLTGKASPAVLAVAARARPGVGHEVELAPRAAPAGATAHPRWLRPAAFTAGALSLACGGVALQQALAARGAGRDADALLRGDGTYVGDPAGYARLHAAAAGARRNAWIGAAGTAAFAATAAVLGYLSWDHGAPVVRF